MTRQQRIRGGRHVAGRIKGLFGRWIGASGGRFPVLLRAVAGELGS